MNIDKNNTNNEQDESGSILEEVLSSKRDQEILEFEPTRLAFDLLNDLDGRSRDIIVKRFSLDGKGEQTLESIGEHYGITRERVRQIESVVLDRLHARKEKNEVEAADKIVVDILADHGHVAEENFLLSKILGSEKNTPPNRNALIFLMHLSRELKHLSETILTKKGWAHRNADVTRIEQIIKHAHAILESLRKPLTSKELAEEIIHAASEHAAELDHPAVISHVLLSKKIHKNPFDEWGLIEWREIIPKGVKDKAYVVLKKHAKPLHFVDLTELINKSQFDHKTAYPQTVHNELIKDNRFVLVGRGMYALKDWGYEPGTVSEVLERILQETGKPMSREELVSRVLATRFVKKNTVLLALQDKKRFKKIKNNYILAD